MTVLRALILAFCLLPADASSGAWQREQGSGFVSATARFGWPQDIGSWASSSPTQKYYTLYAEYGLTNRVTLGFDLGHAVSGSEKMVAFVQWPLRDRDSGAKIAFQLGLGQIDGAAVVRPGLSLGWGRERGWLSIDSVAEVGLKGGATDLKIDLTWGRNLRKDRKLIVQLQTGLQEGDAPFARIAPSLVTPLRKGMKLETGLAMGLTGDTSMGVMTGIWMEF